MKFTFDVIRPAVMLLPAVLESQVGKTNPFTYLLAGASGRPVPYTSFR
jgi:hypothetical protein